MSSKTNTKSKRPSPKFDSVAFQMYQHPAFVQAVNRVANIKCLEAIKAGKLRVVTPSNTRGPHCYTPRMDLINDPMSSKVTALFELPGIKSSDISLEIQNGQLVVFGKRHPPPLSALQRSHENTNSQPSNADAAGYMAVDDVANDQPNSHPDLPVQELRYGTFRRAIRVSDGMKESDVNATLHEGMLTVTWPKSPVGRTASPSISSKGSPPASGPSGGTALQ